MPKLNMAPTKSNLLALRRQLAFAEEGFDLLEQKRQILIFELMTRLNHAEAVESSVAEALREAFATLREAELDGGSERLDQAALGVRMDHQAAVSGRHLMGLRIPGVTAQTETTGVRFGVGGTPSNADLAMSRFVEVLPLLAEMAELENAVLRIARELRKTQRRCNALSKIFIPEYRETIGYIMGSLEERERESFVILKMIRDRLGERDADHDSSS